MPGGKDRLAQNLRLETIDQKDQVFLFMSTFDVDCHCASLILCFCRQLTDQIQFIQFNSLKEVNVLYFLEFDFKLSVFLSRRSIDVEPLETLGLNKFVNGLGLGLALALALSLRLGLGLALALRVD